MAKRSPHKREEVGYGYVELLDYWGSDHSIAMHASVCTQKDKPDTDSVLRRLIRPVQYNQHTSPLEFGGMIFRMRLPIFVARHWVRHRTASINERSMRYTALDPNEDIDSLFYIPKQHEWRIRADLDNKELREDLTNYTEDLYKEIFSTYRKMLERGVSKEQARTILPVSMYTTWDWCCDLSNILKLLRLRLSPSAQLETQEYAIAVSHFVKQKFPLTYGLWEERVLEPTDKGQC